MSSIKKQLTKLPDSPGVYFFVGRAKGQGLKASGSKRMLYIGKATSIRDRVRSYFVGNLLESRGSRLVKMIGEITDIKYEKTDSVLEALILEANLIRKHQPEYNSLGKDDRSYAHMVITNEVYPRVFSVRERELREVYDPDDFKYIFGPYPQGGMLREALKIIRRIFPYLGEKDKANVEASPSKKGSPLRRQIGMTPDFNKISRRDYLRTIQNIRLFFEGKKRKLLKKLEIEMKGYAKKQEFEKAYVIKRQLFALQHIRDVSLVKNELRIKNNEFGGSFRIEGYDIAHLSGLGMVGVVVVIEDGEPSKNDYRKFNIKTVSKSNDTGALKEVLERRFKHDEWLLPKLIVVDGGKAQINVARKVMDKFGYQIPVVAVTKGQNHKARRIMSGQNNPRTSIQPSVRKVEWKYESEILLANQEAHRFALAFHRRKRKSLL